MMRSFVLLPWINQVLPATPTDEKSIHVHLFDTHESHMDTCDRKFHPAYRDTKNSKEVHDSRFKATVAKPQHFLEFKDTLPASSLLTRNSPSARMAPCRGM